MTGSGIASGSLGARDQALGRGSGPGAIGPLASEWIAATVLAIKARIPISGAVSAATSRDILSAASSLGTWLTEIIVSSTA
jgi:hypothetical protein